jgi:aminoglycoside 3-N-acetyltransferase
MEPEKGDPSIKVGIRDVAQGFRAVGAVSGDTVLFHGSLSSMGTVEGGPTTVINGVLEATNPNGTVAMPSLWFHGKEPLQKPQDFDVKTSPSYVGALSEAFRTDPRSVRSHDWSHSVSAIGARAAELVAGHDTCPILHTPWSLRAFSDGSPWDKLYQWNALYCFIGVTMRVCTMKHYMEARILAECLRQAPPDRHEALQARLVRYGAPGIWPSYNSELMGELLAKRGLVRVAKIGSATLRAIRARTLVDETFPLLRQAPQDWFAKPFLELRAECLSKGHVTC